MRSRAEALALSLLLVLMPMAAHPDSVILLHGLARSDRSMGKLERALADRGYAVENIRYASTRKSIEALADEAIAPALARLPADAPVHFVTHSLGGILVRQYLYAHRVDNLGRVVMLGPPNQGAEVVDKLRDFPGFRFIHGEAGLELGTGEGSVPNQLGAANFDLGVIAGTRSINLLLSAMIPGPNDGTVSVESTRLEGMRDHVEMEVTHTFMMYDDAVIDQVIHYLEHGRFHREEQPD